MRVYTTTSRRLYESEEQAELDRRTQEAHLLKMRLYDAAEEDAIKPNPDDSFGVLMHACLWATARFREQTALMHQAEYPLVIDHEVWRAICRTWPMMYFAPELVDGVLMTRPTSNNPIPFDHRRMPWGAFFLRIRTGPVVHPLWIELPPILREKVLATGTTPE